MSLPDQLQKSEPLVPNFERFYEQEDQLPQHDPELPYPEGKLGRYLYVSNQHWGECESQVSLLYDRHIPAGLGWNNILQNVYVLWYLSSRHTNATDFCDRIMLSHLAYKTNRS